MQEKVKVKSLTCVQFFVTLWTVAYEAPLSMEFSRREYWSGLPFSSPVDLPHPGMEPRSPALHCKHMLLSSEPAGKFRRLGFNPWVRKIPQRRVFDPDWIDRGPGVSLWVHGKAEWNSLERCFPIDYCLGHTKEEARKSMT